MMFSINITFYVFSVFVYEHMCPCTHLGTHIEVREQLTGVSFLLPSRGSQKSNSGYQAWYVTCRADLPAHGSGDCFVFVFVF